MDATRFDALVRSIDVLAPRRAALALLGGGLTAVLMRVGIADVAGKKKKRKKKKKKCKGNTRKCGKTCIPKDNCCNDADCGGDILSCVDGFCLCPDSTEIPCTASSCCDPATEEICAVTETGAACEAGGCPDTDYCSDPNLYVCGLACDCVTSVDFQTTCSDFFGLCTPCESDAQCSALLEADAICVANGEFCTGCAADSFCILTGCPESGPERRAGIASRIPGKEPRRLR